MTDFFLAVGFDLALPVVWDVFAGDASSEAGVVVGGSSSPGLLAGAGFVSFVVLGLRTQVRLR